MTAASVSDCPTCDLLAEWDEAMARVRGASRRHRALAQAMALDVAEQIIAGIERHEQGPAPP